MGIASISTAQLSVPLTREQNSSLGRAVQQPITQNEEDQRAATLSALEQNAAQPQNITPSSSELTPEEQEIVDDLQQTDQEVRRHERAHATVGGPYAGQPTYTTVTGPDGRQYAVAGEVSIDTSPIPNNPEATIRKLDIVIRAALAPADPSAQDRQVAAQARAARLEAQRELREQSSQVLLSAQEQSQEESSELFSTNLVSDALEVYQLIDNL